MKRLTDKNHNAVNRCGEYSSCYSCNREKCYISELADKLAEFEDFMEGNKFENIENLQNAINGKFQNIFDETHKVWIKVVEDKVYVEKKNRILEERWQKLKEWVEEFQRDVVAVYPKTLLDKMKELEE